MSAATLLAGLGARVSEANLYRLCQLIEQYSGVALGVGQHPAADPVRLLPAPGMGFPASEVLAVQWPPAGPPTLRTGLLGLYGVDAPLPGTWLDAIAQRREGSDALAGLLDLFNHRLFTQFYRIWRKYSYPATFEAGGSDRVSRCLLGLVGLGVAGSAEHIATPVSRFLALLGVMRLPTRTAEGLQALVRLLEPGTQATVQAHSPRAFRLARPAALGPPAVALGDGVPLGALGYDHSSEVLLVLACHSLEEGHGWLPGGTLLRDLHLLLRVFLGWRCSARLRLCLPRQCLPVARLGHPALYLGQTALLPGLAPGSAATLTLELGRYSGLPLENCDAPVEMAAGHVC